MDFLSCLTHITPHYGALSISCRDYGVIFYEFIFSLETRTHTTGTALYRDRYVRDNGIWKIAHSEYDCVIELVQPLRDDITIASHYLAKSGRRLADRTDISHLIQWTAKG